MGGKFEDFWCCHGTLVQANARYREFVFYQAKNELIIAQYFPAELQTDFSGIKAKITQDFTDMAGSHVLVNDIARENVTRPNCLKMNCQIQTESPVIYEMKFRKPWWTQGQMKIMINGQMVDVLESDGYISIKKVWEHDIIDIEIPFGITCWPLADEPDTVAFLEGPVVLAGLVSEERMLLGDVKHPETILKRYHERQWSTWTSTYKTINQYVNFKFVPIKEIGNQIYTVYFSVKNNLN